MRAVADLRILILFTKSISPKSKGTEERFAVIRIHPDISCPCTTDKDRFYIVLIISFT